MLNCERYRRLLAEFEAVPLRMQMAQEDFDGVAPCHPVYLRIRQLPGIVRGLGRRVLPVLLGLERRRRGLSVFAGLILLAVLFLTLLVELAVEALLVRRLLDEGLAGLPAEYFQTCVPRLAREHCAKRLLV